MSFRSALIWLNAGAIAVVALVFAVRVLSLRRNPEPKEPENKTPFFGDEDLEGRKLERVLGWSLLFTVVIAISLPVYFLVEPDRQVQADDDFEERAIEAGAVLFANEQSPEFDGARSLLCANCHGADGSGGSAPFVLRPEAPSCDLEAEVTEDTPIACRPVQVSWEAPPLDVVLLRYPRREVFDIVTYGRPGTPMPAWGVASGEGVLNEQSVDDLVTYLESIQITEEEAKRRFTEEYETMRDEAATAVTDAEDTLAEAEAARLEAPVEERTAAEDAVTEAESALEAARDSNETVQNASDGELLFMLQCARCHTKGWSYYDPLDPSAAPAPRPQGSGAYGPNLTGGAELAQFPGADGVEQQVLFIAEGVDLNKAYGVRGVYDGGMPHFNQTLTPEQIAAIVEYERGL